IGFLGRRETIIAPIVGFTSDTTPVNTARIRLRTWEIWVIRVPILAREKISSLRRKSNKRESTRSATHATHSDQASLVAAWVPNPPPPRPCFLVPSVTTPLYSTTVCQALRQPLRSQAVSELPRMPKRRSSQNFYSTHFGE